MLAAAKHVEDHCDAVDLNLGCPQVSKRSLLIDSVGFIAKLSDALKQGIARKGRYGSFLMKEKAVVKEIVSTLSAGLSIPVTVKIRVFPDDQETLEFCDMLQAAGADLLTVHGRTKEMNKTAVREVDWDIIRRIKARLTIPVIANGGLEVPEDIEKCLAATQADGVMSSEGLLENPALFAASNNSPGNDISFLELAKQYLDCAEQYPPASEKIIRAHLFKILFQDLRVHSDLRESLADAKSRKDMISIVDQLEERLENAKKDPSLPQVVYAAETSWYRRHRQGQAKLQRKDSYEKVLDTGFGNLFG